MSYLTLIVTVLYLIRLLYILLEYIKGFSGPKLLKLKALVVKFFFIVYLLITKISSNEKLYTFFEPNKKMIFLILFIA